MFSETITARPAETTPRLAPKKSAGANIPPTKPILIQIVVRNNIKWSLDLDEGIDLSVYLFGTSERKISNLKKLLSKKDNSLTIIDIGANIGSVCLKLARIFENSKIFAIEPTNYAYNKLFNNLKLNFL